MSRFYKILSFAVLLFSGMQLTAQTLTIGSGSFVTASNQYGPFRTISTANQWNRNAYIYPATLVNAIPSGSSINSIEFYRDGTIGVTGTLTCKIYLKNTAAIDFGTSAIDFIAEEGSATLVYNSDPTTIIGTTAGYKQFPLIAPFVYSGGSLEVLVEYSQTTAQTANIQWAYDNAGSVPAYNDNQDKYANGTGTLPAATTTTGTNQRHPTMKVNYTPFVFGNDMTVSAAVSPLNNASLTAGTPVTVTATVKNNGSNPQTGVPVYYRVDGGTPVGPVNTTGTMNQNDVQNVTLPSYTPASGYHVIKIYTALAGEQNVPNDTLKLNVLAGPISSFPFLEQFTPTIGWTANASLWSIVTVTTQANGSGGQAAAANFYSGAAGTRDTLRSPTFNFSGVANPLLTYNFTHQTYTSANPEPDGLAVIVSTDGGSTWSAPLLTKYANGSPSLNTIPGSTAQYNPQSRSDWRHEMVNLSAYSGQANVKIGFIAISGLGNQLVIDNILVSNASSYAAQAVTVPGVQTAANGVTINFTGTIIPNGTLKVAKYTSLPVASPYNTNTTATTQDGSIFTPNVVAGNLWYTVTYDSLATYSISIDISSIAAPVPTKLYIVKRSAQNDSWTALSTTLSGSVLTATGLTSFSDFAIGADNATNPIPVELMKFTAQRTGKVNQISWSTSQELNSNYFSLERSSDGRNFAAIAQVAAAGYSAVTQTYAYTDNSPVNGVNYYRLKVVDKDNSSKYSWVRSVRNEGMADVAVYPNPAKEVMTVSITADRAVKGNMMISDVNGKVVYSNTVSVAQGINALPVNLSNVAAGAYIIKIQLGDDVVVRKFNKL